MTTTESKPMTVADVINGQRRPTVTAEVGITGSSFFLTLWPHGTARGGSDKTIQIDRETAIAFRDELTRLIELG